MRVRRSTGAPLGGQTARCQPWDTVGMRRTTRRPGFRPGVVFVCALFAAAALAAAPPADTVGLKVGDEAPPFSLPGSDGRTYTLAEFRGVKPVVLAWFPKAFAKV